MTVQDHFPQKTWDDALVRYDREAIALLSMMVHDRYRADRDARKAGCEDADERDRAQARRGEVLPPVMYRSLAYRLVRACARGDHVPPNELVEMMRVVFDQDTVPPSAMVSLHLKRARVFLVENPDASQRDLAKHLGVSPAWVAAHYKDGSLP